jgi:peptidoglycan/xylan/chitin deacetylase (PgdA/CDA1 family)
MGLSDLAVRVATQRPFVDLVERFLRRSARSQGPAGRPRIALTFDDGPHPDWTPKVLDALDRASARATFFVVGRCVEACPDLVVETRRRGHEIGSHLYSHDRGTVFDDHRFNDELTRSRDQLESLLGEKLRWLRFPYGVRGRQDPRAIKRTHGIDTAHWTYSSHDGKLGEPDAIVARVAAGLRAGAILLLHDALADEKTLRAPYVAARNATLAALPRIGELLASRALTSVTLSQLFGES